MYSKDMLIGILLGLSKMDFILERSSASKMGYIVRLSLSLRADEKFLLGVKRSLLQHEITSSYKEKESKTRPRPILKIGGIKNLYKIVEMTPNLPDAKDEWTVFREVVHLVSHGEHRNAEGLERIFELKGVI
tara:strand:- start:135 stop:530 length:396 start_codon:yes stop_codon:yes gene_type:complete